MRLVYITTKSFPATTADHVYVRSLAKAFDQELPHSFSLVVNRDSSNELHEIREVISLNLFKRAKSLQFFFSFPALYKRFRGSEDLVFTSNDVYILTTLRIYGFFLRSFRICSDWHIIRSSVLFTIAAKGSDKCICVTSHLKNSLIEQYGIPADDILVTPNGIDLNTFALNAGFEEVREQLKLPKDKIILGYFGRFKTMGMDKGIKDILCAMQELDNRYLFFAAGGYASDIEFYSEMAAKLGVKDKIVFIGDSTQTQLARYQKACDMLLMPFPNIKHYAYDMSPMKMFEYMASERPIITSDLPSVREVLNEQNSILIEPDNPKSLSAAIKKLAESPALGKELATRAFTDVAHFTWNAKAKNIIAFLNA